MRRLTAVFCANSIRYSPAVASLNCRIASTCAAGSAKSARIVFSDTCVAPSAFQSSASFAHSSGPADARGHPAFQPNAADVAPRFCGVGMQLID